MSFIYWLSKFTKEAITIELFLITLFVFLFFTHLLFKRRKYGVANKQISDQVVRAFLTDILSNVESFKTQLFGQDFKPNLNIKSEPIMNSLLGSMGAASAGPSAHDSADLAALKAQLAQAISKQTELANSVSALTTEKSSLQTKLAEASKAGAAAGGGGGGGLSAEDKKALAEAQEKIRKLQSMLAEYEVIEDDLANLKRYQQENKQLKSELDSLKSGKPTSAPAPVAAAPAPAAEPTPLAEMPLAEEPNPLMAEAPLTETSLGASATDSAALTEAQTAPAVSDDALGIAATAAPAEEPKKEAPVAEAIAESATPPSSTDADLLQEFEKMLNS